MTLMSMTRREIENLCREYLLSIKNSLPYGAEFRGVDPLCYSTGDLDDEVHFLPDERITISYTYGVLKTSHIELKFFDVIQMNRDKKLKDLGF